MIIEEFIKLRREKEALAECLRQQQSVQHFASLYLENNVGDRLHDSLDQFKDKPSTRRNDQDISKQIASMAS